MHLIRKSKEKTIYWIIGNEEEYADITIERLLIAQTQSNEKTFSNDKFKNFRIICMFYITSNDKN